MKLYIFDIDGTLTDTTQVDDKCFIRTFAEQFGNSVDEMDFSTFQHVTDKGILKEWFQRVKERAISEEEYETFKKAFIEDLRAEGKRDKNQFAPIKGAVDFINFLKQQDNAYLALATGAWQDSALIKLQTAGIPYQDIPLSHSDSFTSREAILQNAIKQAKDLYEINFQQMVYFGDGVWDYKTCQNLDIPFIGIDAHQNGKLKALGQAQVYKDWQKVKDSIFKGY